MSQKSQQLCDFCGLKPKFPPYDHCSKTCGNKAQAAQAINCDYCKKKPKFGNHNFCGKQCADKAQAQAQNVRPTQVPVPAPPRNQPRQAPAPHVAPASKRAHSTTTNGTVTPLDVAKIAQLVIDGIQPKLQQMLASERATATKNEHRGERKKKVYATEPGPFPRPKRQEYYDDDDYDDDDDDLASEIYACAYPGCDDPTSVGISGHSMDFCRRHLVEQSK